MALKRNALGRGLDALLSMDDVQTEGSSSINEIELSKIVVNPNQPRREFDPTALQELAAANDASVPRRWQASPAYPPTSAPPTTRTSWKWPSSRTSSAKTSTQWK